MNISFGGPGCQGWGWLGGGKLLFDGAVLYVFLLFEMLIDINFI